MHDMPEVVQLCPPEDDVTVYDVTDDPPSVIGALQETVAVPSPGTATPEVGGPGTVAGTTPGLGSLEGPAPARFVASTENVYVVPLLNPPITHDIDVVEQVAPPGDAVAT
jgi:hypothetical protein